jgi:neutral amino acid transport system permease protein
MQGYIVSLIIFTAVFALFSLGLNLQWGFTGLINFGHVAFMTVGAYATVLLSLQGVPLVIAALIGAAIAALLGLLMGVATLRLRTDYLAIVTVGVSEMIRLVAGNEEWLTRGTLGIQRFPLPLAEWQPSLPIRVVMAVIFTGIIGGAYWRVGRSLYRQLQAVPRPALRSGFLSASGYFGSLGGLLFLGGIVARQLKQINMQPWALAVLASLGAIVWLYIWLAPRFARRFSQWSTGISLLSTLTIGGMGLWLYRFAIQAIWDYDNPSKTGLMWISVVVLAIVFLGLEKLVRSPWGRVLQAIREDEEVATALGKNVFWYKLQSLMLGGAIAGLAGALYAWQLTVVFPVQFDTLVTFNAWTIVVIGGAGSNPGTILGAAIFWAYDTMTRFVLREIIPLSDASLGAFRIMVIGLILMVIMVWRPQGILGKKEELTLGK